MSLTDDNDVITILHEVITGDAAMLTTRAKIIKIGNSRGVRIPRQVIEQARLQDEVEMTVQGDRLIIRSVSPTPAEEIVFNERNTPIIGGTTMKVIELVAEHLAYGWSPEELQYQHPYLTMGQVYAGLSYYWNHKAEIDAELDRQEKEYTRLRTESMDSPVRKKLRKKGLL
jgi:uncharacterized protein (DUF433 family)/virulence-associated protein VagC